MRYLYVPGRSAGHLPALLLYEPELDPQQRFVLKANGDISSVSSAEVRAALEREAQP
jgi:hypothetical protein